MMTETGYLPGPAHERNRPSGTSPPGRPPPRPSRALPVPRWLSGSAGPGRYPVRGSRCQKTPGILYLIRSTAIRRQNERLG